MKKIYLLLLVLLAIPMHSQKKKQAPENDFIRQDAFFKANDNNKYWTLEISALEIKFISIFPNESFNVPYAAPVTGVDKTVYRSSAKGKALEISVSNQKCAANPMEVSVKLVITQKDGVAPQILEGCGSYIPDQRLNVVWVLQELDGKRVLPSDFGQELPYVDLHIDDLIFTGFAGCNRINGALMLAEADKLVPKDLKSTRMSCLGNNQELRFLESFKSANRYEIRQNRLFVFDGQVLKAVFKKAT